jgi:hypothetical protein
MLGPRADLSLGCVLVGHGVVYVERGVACECRSAVRKLEEIKTRVQECESVVEEEEKVRCQ